ncbi:hypothetical protein AGMMS49938_15630 [Fibrobacterales bacterium]|nr:hypothetical protein AGMMS49938_15630 [Fibrobacterales bacterium]
MISVGIDIPDLKKAVAKKPKSLLFARLADELRQTGLGVEQNLDESLLIANKGLEANPDFLPGRLARGRILLEKGDLIGAKIDFELVSERDPFCISARALLNGINKSNAPSTVADTENLQASAVESKTVEAEPDNTPPAVSPAAPAPKFVETELKPYIPKSKREKEAELETSLSLAIDNTFDSIFGNLELPPASDLKFNDAEQAPAHAESPAIDEIAPAENIPEPKAEQPAQQSLDDILAEQLRENTDESPNLSLAGDLDDLLKEVSTANITPAAEIPAEPTAEIPAQTPAKTSDAAPKTDTAPNLDDILKEQLADKVEELPDLMGDMDDLLKDLNEPQKAEEKPKEEPKAQTPADFNLDDLLAEQLSSKVEDDASLIGDMDNLLNEAKADDLASEQLVDKVDFLPDLTDDMDELLKEAEASKTEESPAQISPAEVNKESEPASEDDLLTQSPTPTLAELYLNQDLPEKAAEVYRALIAKDPENELLQDRLIEIEKEIKEKESKNA